MPVKAVGMKHKYGVALALDLFQTNTANKAALRSDRVFKVLQGGFTNDATHSAGVSTDFDNLPIQLRTYTNALMGKDTRSGSIGGHLNRRLGEEDRLNHGLASVQG